MLSEECKRLPNSDAIGEMAKHRDVDVVLGEPRRVFGHPDQTGRQQRILDRAAAR